MPRGLADCPSELLQRIMQFVLDDFRDSLLTRVYCRLCTLSLVSREWQAEAKKLDDRILVVRIADDEQDDRIPDFDTRRVRLLHVQCDMRVRLLLNNATTRLQQRQAKAWVAREDPDDEEFVSTGKEGLDRKRIAAVIVRLNALENLQDLRVYFPRQRGIIGPLEPIVRFLTLAKMSVTAAQMMAFHKSLFEKLERLVLRGRDSTSYSERVLDRLARCRSLKHLSMTAMRQYMTVAEMPMEERIFQLQTAHGCVYDGDCTCWCLSHASPASIDVSTEHGIVLPSLEVFGHDRYTARDSIVKLELFLLAIHPSTFQLLWTSIFPAVELLVVAQYYFLDDDDDNDGDVITSIYHGARGLMEIFPALTHVRLGRMSCAGTEEAALSMTNAAIRQISAWKAGLTVQLLRDGAWSQEQVKDLDAACAASSIKLEWLEPLQGQDRFVGEDSPRHVEAWHQNCETRDVWHWDDKQQLEDWLRVVQIYDNLPKEDELTRDDDESEDQ